MSDQERMERKKDFRICEPAMVAMVKKNDIFSEEHDALSHKEGQNKLAQAKTIAMKGKR